ncbi:MAG: sigma-70 family RNA polymerase sigma factor [Ruminococcus sp.]|nr:sigma-70 family RNA polymerase sigma factor [Ruminococcus sp.]
MIDKETCGILFRKYHNYVYDFCFKYLENIHAAEDCTQEVFLIMLKKKSKINLSRSLLSWLRKTSKNVCKEYLRKNPTVFADIDNYSETISDAGSSVKKELPDEIYEFLDKEDADLLFKYINADCNERRKTAERMGITSNALCKRVIKIKRKLQKYLTDNT